MTKQPQKSNPKNRKRVAHKRAAAPAATPSNKPPTNSKAGAPPLTKLGTLERALRTKSGATIPDLMELTGWQAHSVRGALAGALKNRGLAITSAKVNGERRYRIEVSA